MPVDANCPKANLILIGPRGAGKTCVGRSVALRLSRPFRDTDEMVVQKSGKTIARIFEEKGEERFRLLEAEAVSTAASGDGYVIAVGSGAVEDPENVRILKRSGLVCWLRAPAETLLRRTGADPSSAAFRPPLTDLDPFDEISSILERREPIYRAAADFRLETGTLSPEEVAAEVVKIFLKG